jgi:hypothetical protein
VEISGHPSTLKNKEIKSREGHCKNLHKALQKTFERVGKMPLYTESFALGLLKDRKGLI